MDKLINVGLIGCGMISGMHLRALEAIPCARVVAICDIDIARAEAAAQKYAPRAAIFTDYRAMLAQAEIDAAHILTPHYLHTEMAITALNAGKYVLCEKPMATSRSDARAMIAADEYGRLGVIFQNRYNDATVRAKEILASGELGAIQAIKASVTWKRDEIYYASEPWRGLWATEGGGILINQAIHTIDQILYLGGRVAAVKGSITRDFLGAPYEVEDTAHAAIRFEAGHRALLYATNSFAADDPPSIDLCMERGRLRIEGDCLFEIVDGAARPMIVPEPADNGAKAVYGNSHVRQIADFYRSVREKRPILIDGSAAYPAIWAVLSIYESSRSGEWVAFS